MQISGMSVVITGGASGIGRELARQAAAMGARHIAILDINMDGAKETLQDIENSSVHHCNVGDAKSVEKAVAAAKEAAGGIDIFFSNAGIGLGDRPHWTAYGHSDEDWQRGININVMSHVYAARFAVPDMVGRGKGAFIITASAAGLLTQIGDTIYTATKFASVGFADSLAITHGDDGLQVSVVCPEGVATPLTANLKGGAQDANGVKTAEEAAATILAGVEAGDYFITTHETTPQFLMHKAQNYNRWVGGMRKFRRNLIAANGGVPIIMEEKK